MSDLTNLTKIFFFALSLFTSMLIGYGAAKIGSDRVCETDVVKAYALGKQNGLAEAQQSGSCVRWWTGATTADIQAARRSFCRGRW